MILLKKKQPLLIDGCFFMDIYHMDKKLFEQLLTEIADWEYPMAMDDAVEAQKVKRLIREYQKKGMNEEEIREALKEYRNETYPAKVVKIKAQPTDCSDCGKHCPTGRRVDYRIYKGKKGQKKWCGKCSVCRKQTNPYDGKYTLTNLTAANTWWEWIRTTGVDNPRPKKVVEAKPAHLDPEFLKKKYGLDHLG